MRRRPSLARSRVAAAVFALAVLTVGAPAEAATYRAAAVQEAQDGRNDVVSETGPAHQPEADIVSVSGEHRGDKIFLRVLVAQPTDPARHPAWAGVTFVAWGIDTPARPGMEYVVGYGRNEAGNLTYEVGRWGDSDPTVLCTGPGDVAADGAYTVTIPASCFEGPATIGYGVVVMWDTNPDDPDAAVVHDGAPEEGLFTLDGPAAAPAPSPAPTDAEPDPSFQQGDGGYWLAATDGGIFSFGDAAFWGSTGHLTLNQPIVTMAADPDRKGYWLVARDGGVFAFEAPFFGSTGAIRLNQPIVGMAPTPSGHGYWMVAADGGIFAFGDADFFGSTGDIRLNQPIVGMAAAKDGTGYWFVARDGGIFSFGSAQFYGAAVGSTAPVVGMAAARDGAGYSIVRADGSVANRGSAPKPGSAAGVALNKPIAAIAVVP